MSDPDPARGPPRTPRATYRLQLHAGFDFDAAAEVVPYLAALGISHVYASPVTAARPGSTHGYDVVDPRRLNPELGGRDGFDRFVDAVHRHGMGLLLDFVPNHMGIGPANGWWMDVLEWGRTSPRAGYFDIDWDPPGPGPGGQVLLPVLGDHYGAALERGELRVRFAGAEGSFSVHYFDRRFPLAPGEDPPLLRDAATAAREEGEPGARLLDEVASEIEEGLRLRARGPRRNRVARARGRLEKACATDDALPRAIARVLDALNGRPGEPGSFDALDRILRRQAYRLAFWRVAAFEINYRRFFDIDDLAGLRMENPELFDAAHVLVRDLVERGAVQGLRLDHVDGLRDPEGYLRRLHELTREAGLARPWILVEKILAPHETLPEGWACDGTTGYEFMASVNGLFVDPAGERALTRLHARFTGDAAEFPDRVVEAKRLIMRESLASELNVLANRFHRLARQSRLTRDYTLTGFRTALADVVARFRVYRTYVGPERGASPEDRREIAVAVGRARRHTRQPDTSIYDFIEAVLTLDLVGDGRGAYRDRDIVDVALRFQQYTGPVMAKSVEDTAFYRDHRLVSLNEVGGEPERFGTPPATVHAAARRRLDRHPWSLTATATHDHKRGEDTRARIDVLSEVPREWGRRVRRWARANRRHRTKIEGRASPGPAEEYLFYQTVVGAWPLDLESARGDAVETLRERVSDYMLKAAREAKSRTSWVAPDEEYEAALRGFVQGALGSEEFLDDVAAFARSIAATGAVNGLAQTLVKLAAPGVPDTYQGTERWDLSLVDPDNRRPVDYAVRLEALRAEAGWDELLRSWRDGRIKQRLVRRVLAERAERPNLFVEGTYRPLEATGRHRRRVFAFLRQMGAARLVGVAPRLVHPLMGDPAIPLPGGWDDTALLLPGGGGRLEDRLTGEAVETPEGAAIPVGALLRRLPVALLLDPGGGAG